ncbi:MAG: ribonuclease III [Parcubacteria group bacterium]|nr:ribonuclease III [Parcubacteria group bacterium]
MKSIDFSGFEKKIQVTFKEKALLTQAFTHRSYLNENPEKATHHNERLEFLGDAVLELIVTEFLFGKYPHKTEGELTSYRAALVNTNALAEVSGELGVNTYLLLSRGESKDVGKARQYILANTFEAIVGALYLDQGYATVRDFIARSVFPHLDKVLKERLWQDAKSRFQEKAQEITSITPRYEVLTESGPDHNKIFVVGVFLNNELIAEGRGSSKQIAEQYAAKNALEKKGWT